MSDTDAISNQLSSMRDKYRKAVKEVRDDSKRQVDQVRRTSDINLDNSRTAYDKDKNQILRDNEKTVDEHTKITREKMELATDKFRNEMADTRKVFDQERYQDKKEIDVKLNRIADDYRTRDELSNTRNIDLVEQSKKSADRRMRRDAVDKARDHELFTASTREGMKDLLEKNADDLRMVSDKNSKNLLKVNEYNLRDKNRVRSELNEYIDGLKADKTMVREQSLNEKKEIINRSENAKAVERDRVEKEFGSTINSLSDKAEASRQRTEKNLLNQLNFERKQAQDSSRKNSNIVNDMVETTKTNNQIHENQMGNAKAKVDLIRENATRDVVHNQDEFAERYDVLDRKHQNARTTEKTRLLGSSRQRYNELLNSKIEAVNREKRDGRIMVNRYQQQLRSLARDSDLKIFENNKQTKALLENNNERHHKMTEVMSTRNQKALEEYQEQVHEEKNAIVESTRDQVSETGLQLRKHFGDRISKMEGDHRKKVEKLQTTLDDTIKKYENLLRVGEVRNAKMFDEFQKIAQTEQKLQKKEFIQQIKDNEVQNKYKGDETRGLYEQKLSEAKDQGDLRIMEITNRYEDEISTERKNFYRVLKQKMNESQRSLQSLSRRMDAEKKALRMQMESRISDLQNENRKIRQINVQRREYLDKIEPEEVS